MSNITNNYNDNLYCPFKLIDNKLAVLFMKAKSIFLCVINLLIMISCSQPKERQIKGAWKWISYEYIVGDTVKWTKTSAAPENSGIKMWSDNYFVAIYRIEDDTAFQYSYSGGTYKYEGINYEETIIYHDMINIPEMVGTREMMRLEIRNDTLIQTYPVDEKGKLLKRYTIIEKYVKLD
jgi:hypothetical protein